MMIGQDRDAQKYVNLPDLVFFVEQIDSLIETFRESAARGCNLTVQQIVEYLLPPEDADREVAMEFSHALAVPLAILLQRAVMG